MPKKILRWIPSHEQEAKNEVFNQQKSVYDYGYFPNGRRKRKLR